MPEIFCHKSPNSRINLLMDATSLKDPIFSKCVRCGVCLGNCPVYLMTRLEKDSPRGRIEIMRAFKETRRLPEGDLVAAFRNCLFCLQCQIGCPAGVEFDLCVFNALEGIAAESHGEGVRMKRPPSPCNLTGDEGRAEKGRMMLFPGCYALDERSFPQEGMLPGIDLVVPPEKVCCGLPFIWSGDRGNAVQQVKHNLDLFHALNVEVVLTPCPFCLYMFKRFYPILSQDEIDIRFGHLSDLLKSGEGKPCWEKGKRVAYHAPCMLDKETARSHRMLIKEMAKESYVSLGQICCGHGFGLPPDDIDIAKEMRQENLRDISRKGIEVLITDCVSCTKGWEAGITEGGWKMEVFPFWMLYQKGNR